MIFGPQEYSNEKAAFDGKRLTLGDLRLEVGLILEVFS
jgi:hypothetical protein